MRLGKPIVGWSQGPSSIPFHLGKISLGSFYRFIFYCLVEIGVYISQNLISPTATCSFINIVGDPGTTFQSTSQI